MKDNRYIGNNEFLVLIVDDMPANQKLLGTILRDEGYRIEYACNGVQGLEKIKKERPSIVLLDIEMPEMDGFELCNILRSNKETAELPVVFLTAHTEKEAILKGFEVGGQDYVAKAVGPREVIARVQTQLKLVSQKAALQSMNKELESKVQQRTKELEEKNRQLQISLNEKRLLLKEVHHRVKNNLQFISSILSMQLGKYENSEMAFICREYQNRIKSLALVHEELYQAKNFTDVDLARYVQKNFYYLCGSHNVDKKRIQFFVSIDDISIGIDYAIPCGLIINELLSNALRFAFPDGKSGEIQVAVQQDENLCCLSVSDNGVAMSESFDIMSVSSCGFQVISILADQLKGTIAYENGIKKRFLVRFAL